MKDPDCVALLLNFIKKLEKQITKIFDNTNELKEKQIKGESHLQELGDAVDFLTKKLDKYKQKREEGQEIINNLTQNVDDLSEVVESKSNIQRATACYYMEFLKRNKKLLMRCVSKR